MVKASDVVLILVAIIFPPAAALVVTGCSCDLLINILLTMYISTFLSCRFPLISEAVVIAWVIYQDMFTLSGWSTKRCRQKRGMEMVASAVRIPFPFFLGIHGSLVRLHRPRFRPLWTALPIGPLLRPILSFTCSSTLPASSAVLWGNPSISMNIFDIENCCDLFCGSIHWQCLLMVLFYLYDPCLYL